ncbi:MAG: hypothetical protein JOZ81_35295, partial [Chloroflexi bacterium]|nr:hypothetical protein [Chloroflexota bacterium]
RASVEWSYALLGDREQRVLRRLSVLEDGFTLADAAAACAGDDLPPQHLVPAIDRLVGQSVLRCAESNSVTHFSLYAHVRQYARELLEEPGELARARPRAESARIKVQVGVKAEPAQASLSAPVRNASERYAETLSQREREVVRLIADGRSNRDIAEELVITKKTAEAHVSHILTKLGLCSRVQVATWSLQHDVTTGVG